MTTGESLIDRFRRWYSMQPEALRLLLTINVVLYLLWGFLFRHIGFTNQLFYQHLTLHPELPGLIFEPWQLITYNFLHLGGGLGGFLHILFNMLWLYWIGRDYEQMHGSHKLFALYIVTGIGGGLLTLLVYSVIPQAAFVYGASASVIGVLCGVATLYPNRGIGLLFIGVVPLKYLVVGFLALDLLFGLGSGVAVSAHFGGAIAGFLFARAERMGMNVGGWARVFFPNRRQSRSGFKQRLGNFFSRRESKQGPKTKETNSSEASVVTRINEDEVDRILDKISEEGYESLTEEERRILFEASKR